MDQSNDIRKTIEDKNYYVPECACGGILQINFDLDKLKINYQCDKNNHIRENIFLETFEKYIRSFEDTTQELIVRICWFPDKAPSKPDSIEGMLKMRARFDEAIVAESGERIGKGKFNWLEWAYREKLFGDPFGYTMKKGSLYRIRVRKKKDSANNADIYYVEL